MFRRSSLGSNGGGVQQRRGSAGGAARRRSSLENGPRRRSSLENGGGARRSSLGPQRRGSAGGGRRSSLGAGSRRSSIGSTGSGGYVDPYYEEEPLIVGPPLIDLLQEENWEEVAMRLEQSVEECEDVDTEGLHALHIICEKQDAPIELVRIILGANPSAIHRITKYGYPLHFACNGQASADVIRILLISYPEACGIANDDGLKPIDIAERNYPTTDPDKPMILYYLSKGVAYWNQVQLMNSVPPSVAADLHPTLTLLNKFLQDTDKVAYEGLDEKNFLEKEAIDDEYNILPEILMAQIGATLSSARYSIIETREDLEKRVCIACRDRMKRIVLIPCMHLTLCGECVKRTKHCPQCGEKYRIARPVKARQNGE